MDYHYTGETVMGPNYFGTTMYERLGLDEDCSRSDVILAYERWKADTDNLDLVESLGIQMAYMMLSDPELRRVYDEELKNRRWDAAARAMKDRMKEDMKREAPYGARSFRMGFDRAASEYKRSVQGEWREPDEDRTPAADSAPPPGTHYYTLEVHTTATQQEVRAAYRRQAKRYHPDVNDSPRAVQLFRDCVEAYEVLGDEKRRHHYDVMNDIGRRT